MIASPPSRVPNADVVGTAGALVATAWRSLSWKHVATTALLCLTWTGIELAAIAPHVAHLRFSPSLNSLLSMQLNGFAVMLAVLVADQVSPSHLHRWWPYVIAVMVGVAAGTTLFWLVTQRLFTIASAYQQAGLPERFETIAFRHASSRLVICGLATYVYASRRWANDRIAALRTAQLGRTRTEKRLLESKLAAMQARLDPDFLLTTLGRVENLYEIDAPSADRILKELCAYLRVAIPQAGEPMSTLAREVALANAFLNIVGSESRERVVLADVGTSSDDARIPPMVILPLIKHALAHRVHRARGDEVFVIEAVLRDEVLGVTIRDPGGGFMADGVGDAEIRSIRERMAALYGDAATLTLRGDAKGSEALIELPYQ